jgi:hypothetical protein
MHESVNSLAIMAEVRRRGQLRDSREHNIAVGE